MENKCLALSGELWNNLLEIDGLRDDDKKDLNRHIHAIQNILYTKMWIYRHGMVSNEDIEPDFPVFPPDRIG